MKKRSIFSVVLAVLIVTILAFTLVSCKKNKGGEVDDPYLIESDGVYEQVLGDYHRAYKEALDAKDLDQRFALMAVAEAKFLESAVYIPTMCRGGNYAISRAVPNTITNVMYGNDQDRYHQVIVAKTPITLSDRNEMKERFGQMRNDPNVKAVQYENWVKETYFGEGKPYALKNDYTIAYTSDPQTWDVLATFRQPDSAAIVNTFDGLAEYDIFGRLQPAMATSWEQSEDGLTYTFKIRPDVKWVDRQGRSVADFKADDFVAGFQHMLDAHQGPQTLVLDVIKNAAEYMEGQVPFGEVGVKAPADDTVVYTLKKPTTYFMTMLGYNPFAPMSRSFYESKGGKFGSDFDASASDYLYGKDPESIAYCGPYLVTNSTEKNTIVFEANGSYWNKAAINAKKITWKYNDGEDPLKAYDDMVKGTIDGCGLNAEALQKAKDNKDIDGSNNNFEKYHYLTATDSTAFGNFVNVNRKTFANYANDDVGRSPKDAAAIERAGRALKNAHFRRALAFAFDRAAYNAQRVGEKLKEVSLINTYTPGVFVSLDKETTIKINGEDKTFAKGTYYGAIVQAQIDADGLKMKVWDPTADNGLGSSAGFDGWYNPDEAVKELDKAKEDLGFEITKEKPIYVDLPYASADTVSKKQANAYKQAIEESLGGRVIVNLVDVVTYDPDLLQAGFYCEAGSQCNYDLYNVSGWGPDYGDPSTYLNTMRPEDGDMVHCLGIY